MPDLNWIGWLQVGVSLVGLLAFLYLLDTQRRVRRYYRETVEFDSEDPEDASRWLRDEAPAARAWRADEVDELWRRRVG